MAITLNVKDFVVFEGTYTAKDGTTKPYSFAKLDRQSSNNKAFVGQLKDEGVRVFTKAGANQEA